MSAWSWKLTQEEVHERERELVDDAISRMGLDRLGPARFLAVATPGEPREETAEEELQREMRMRHG